MSETNTIAGCHLSLFVACGDIHQGSILIGQHANYAYADRRLEVCSLILPRSDYM